MSHGNRDVSFPANEYCVTVAPFCGYSVSVVSTKTQRFCPALVWCLLLALGNSLAAEGFNQRLQCLCLCCILTSLYMSAVLPQYMPETNVRFVDHFFFAVYYRFCICASTDFVPMSTSILFRMLLSHQNRHDLQHVCDLLSS
jgi:hypothetical protein